jgi:hypothetical protein
LQEIVYGSLDLSKVNINLDQMRQGDDELIADFAIRIKTQKPIMLRVMNNGYADETTVATMVTGMLFNCFMKNLHHDIRQVALAKDFKTIEEAVAGMQ